MRIYCVSLTMFICGSCVRTSYELLLFRARVAPSRVWFFAVFIAMCALWMGWFSLCENDVWRWSLGQGARLFGGALVGGGSILVLGAAGQIFLRRHRDGLLRQGLFAKLRHPMYVGFALWFLGYPLFQRSVSGALLAVIGIAQLLIWARVEERHMLARFGSEYTLYRSQTWF